jgi:hypothetical protein
LARISISRFSDGNQDLAEAILDRLKGSYVCEERIEKGEFVMRWRAETSPLEKPKAERGVVFIDLATGKLRTEPLPKERKIEEKLAPGSAQCNGMVLSVAVGRHVGDWVKTFPASRFVSEGHYLMAADKKTNTVVWQHTLYEWKYHEFRRDHR